MADYVVIDTSSDQKWSIVKKEDKFYFRKKNGNFAKTPGGIVLNTMYRRLADRILSDLSIYGENNFSAESVLPWHYTLVENFSQMSHEDVENTLIQCFLYSRDWTYDIRSSGTCWEKYIGDRSERMGDILTWLSNASHMQMTAICCIGNAYHSINLAFILAIIMENFSGTKRDRMFDELAAFVSDRSEYYANVEDFKTFELYYGIHLEEDGPILNFDIPKNDDNFDESENINISDLTAYQVTVEQLIGRNFYHYTDGAAAKEKLDIYPIHDIEIDESDEEDAEIIEAEDDEDEEQEDLTDYLPEDCWVKRFVDDDNPNICYLLYLEISESGSIEDSGCIEETTQRAGLGNSFFVIPGLNMQESKFYDSISYPPQKVMDDLKRLLKGRSIPLKFSFIGKRLPQQMIDEGGNGGDDTEYTYALQSAYRLAYMHMSVHTTDQGIVEDFYYSSYQSSGSEFGDMFSRPVSISDRKDEVMDMLLYIFDLYSDEELSTLCKNS